MDEISAITRITSATSLRTRNVVNLRWQVSLLQQKIATSYNTDGDLKSQMDQIAQWQKRIDHIERQIATLST